MFHIIPFIVLTAALLSLNNGSCPKYVALGDSLCVGLNAFWGCGYTNLYYRWLVNCKGLRGLNSCNLGVMGWTSSDLLNAVKYSCKYRNAIKEAAIITIDIGGNDIIQSKYTPEKLSDALNCYRENLNSALFEIRCINKCAPLYIMDIYNPYPKCHPMHELAEQWICKFNSVIWNTPVIPEYKISGIASVYSAFKGNELEYTCIRYNNIHPNTLGHRVIFDCFSSVYAG
ncbi:MAG: GDSL-type esterase/lipase family protein [Bacillota bacterium]